ncbi:MAG: hypothetical protein ABL949_16865 [Fimbriimonadaceae bacterium]
MHWFQVKPDKPASHCRPKKLFGTLHAVEEDLDEAQSEGGAIFFQIQIGRNRKARGIQQARCLFLDDDGGIAELPIAPSMSVKTPRGFHHYWMLRPTSELDLWDSIQTGWQRHCGGDPNCNLRNQLGRLPGYFHQKREKQLIYVDQCDEQLIYSLEDFAEFAVPVPKRADYCRRHVGELVPAWRQWPFKVREKILRNALSQVHAATEGTRMVTLRKKSFALGCYATIGVDARLATNALNRIVRQWRDFDNYGARQTICESIYAGYCRALENAPVVPFGVAESWQKDEARQQVLAVVKQMPLPRCVEVDDLIPIVEWQGILSRHQVACRIARILKERGYCRARTETKRYYVLPD